jgi:hypothetical protein
VTKNADNSKAEHSVTSFGTRGSQVQILPLRPALSQCLRFDCHTLRHTLA